MSLSELRTEDPSLPVLLLRASPLGDEQMATGDGEEEKQRSTRWVALPLVPGRTQLLRDLLERFESLKESLPTLSRIRVRDSCPGALVEILDADIEGVLKAGLLVEDRYERGILLLPLGQLPWNRREWLHQLYLEVFFELGLEGFEWRTLRHVREPARSGMVDRRELLALYFLSVPKEQISKEFRDLAGEDPATAIDLLESGVHLDVGDDLQIGQFLKAEDLSPLLESNDPSVRENAISLLHRTGR